MPRRPRPDLAGIPQHVVQRGNNRKACFFADADRRRYLANLGEACLRHDVVVHAYVLMTNHVHLLVTPAEVGAVARMMQCLGRHYVPYVNARYRRTGTLWEGRYKASLVDSGHYVLTCYRYIELNPVRARMVATAGGYAWSSYAANAGGSADPLVHPHPEYLALGRDACSRSAAYSALFAGAISQEQLASIRAHLAQQRAFGSECFL